MSTETTTTETTTTPDTASIIEVLTVTALDAIRVAEHAEYRARIVLGVANEGRDREMIDAAKSAVVAAMIAVSAARSNCRLIADLRLALCL